MAGNHSRRPTRVSTIGTRGLPALLDGRRTAEADIRRALYVRPLGRGFHVVRDVCNEQEYVVADGTGASTFAPGSVVSVGSFTGNPGEFILGRPPAGFGGASAFPVSPGRRTYSTVSDPSVAEAWDFVRPVGIAWNASGSWAHLVRTREVTDEASVISARRLEVARLDRAEIPSESSKTGSTYFELSLSEAELNAFWLAAVQACPGSAVVLYYHLGEAGTTAGTVKMHVRKIAEDGSTSAHVTFDFYDGGGGSEVQLGTVVIGSAIYAVEETYLAGPTQAQRVVRRDLSDLSVTHTYAVPQPSSYDGWSLQGSAARALSKASGSLRLYMEYQQAGTGKYKIFVQTLDTSLALSGSATGFPDNPFTGAVTFGVMNAVQAHPSGGLIFLHDGALSTRTVTGASLSTVLDPVDSDGQTDFIGIAQISSTETLILGSGSTFTTSIVRSTGQELP